MLRVVLPLFALVAACSRTQHSESPRPSASSAPAATSQPPAATAVAVASAAAPAADAAPLTGPASPAAIEAMAAGTYDLEPMVQKHMYVLEVNGAAEDPSGKTKGHPRTTTTHCGAKAKAAIIATAKAMVERAKKYGNPIECDHSHVTTPDPAFGALPASSKLGARPGRPFRYAVCTQAGVAAYDRALQIYFNAPSMNVFGIVDSEVGSSLADEDVATLDGMNTQEIVRCP